MGKIKFINNKRNLGKTGLSVNPIGFGGIPIGQRGIQAL